MTTNRPRSRAVAGVATVEAAITLLAFFVALFAIVEGARLMSAQQALTDAVREGARLAVAPASQTDNLPGAGEVEAEVRRFLDAAKVPDATVNVVRSTNARGDEVTEVTASAEIQLITGSLIGSGPIQLSARSTMRNETSP